MSAYVNRLNERFDPEVRGAGARANLTPFVRSESPIAAMDQRLGLADEPGFGFGVEPGPALGDDEAAPHEPAPAPAHLSSPRAIQRKLANPAAAAPAPPPITPVPGAVARPPSATTTTPSTLIGPAVTAPLTANEERRSESLDPVSLFAPTPRYFDSPDESHGIAPAVAAGGAVSAERPPASSIADAIVTAPTKSFAASSFGATIEAHLPTQMPAPARPQHARVEPPWQPFTSPASGAAALATPSPEPWRHPPQSQPAPLLYIVPRASSAQPLPPAQAEPASSASSAPQQASTTQHTSTERTAVESKQSRATDRRSQSRAELSIDSISQIGPLARHFPNRRAFRLRYS